MRLRDLTDDQLRDLLTGSSYDEPHMDELCRRVPALGTLRMALDAAMQGDEDAQGADLATALDVPESSGTRAVRELYEQALSSWMAGAQNLVTKRGAAEILGMDNPAFAARKLHRWEVRPVAYTGGPRPEALYARVAVEEEARRPRRPGNPAFVSRPTS